MTDFSTISEQSQFHRECQEANRIADRLRGIKRTATPKPKKPVAPKRERTTAASVYEFLREFFAENDQLPPALAISAHFGWKSHTRAFEVLAQLAKSGLIEHNSLGKYRFTRKQEASHV